MYNFKAVAEKVKVLDLNLTFSVRYPKFNFFQKEEV